MEVNTENQIPPQPENIIYSNPTNINPPTETVSKKEKRNFILLGIASILAPGFGFIIGLAVLLFTIKDLVKNKTSKKKIKTVVEIYILGIIIGLILFFGACFLSLANLKM